MGKASTWTIERNRYGCKSTNVKKFQFSMGACDDIETRAVLFAAFAALVRVIHILQEGV